ncbi:GCN5-related N-acetyltransferase [Rhodopseudomonas palustris HaA2]|uniref:GCN5-related N-acetyltransferase n=1 Tax=Rhodopseudomonas palustris (strain HaA2) TaxID=316058 RepID=Q2IY76_RHOP2|nr:GNAT family N-acetyltransferase [Rhodopseudomonas palustris]ABD06834.1 GCN5-related N-acetyltransferase [Rhodopseudomonas palustris HaA2]
MSDLIRRATDDDVAAITDLTMRAYAKWEALIGYAPLPMLADYAVAITQHRFDLLESDGVLAALIETELRDDDLLIVNVAVSPDAQKRGHGRRLLALAEQLARAAGRDTLRLYTNERFDENVRLYASLGYARERLETRANGARVVHMVKGIG